MSRHSYAAYLESLAVLGDLPDVRRAAEIEAEQMGKDALSRALQHEQDFRIRRREFEERVRRLRGPVNRLVDASGASYAEPNGDASDDATWEELVREVETLTREIAAAERDAQWLTRNRIYTPPPAPAAPPPVLIAATPTPPVVQTSAEEPSRGRLSLTPLGWAAIAFLAALVVIALLLLLL